jgi:hypothetical protein
MAVWRATNEQLAPRDYPKMGILSGLANIRGGWQG